MARIPEKVLRNSNILVIDNDTLYRDVTTNILSKAGLRFFLADTLEKMNEALEQQVFNLAVVDMNMVDMATFDLIDFLRNEHQIPVILTTEEDLDQHFDLISEKFITMVLNKPVKSSELINVITKLLNPDPELWFGLENYLESIQEGRRIDITRSNQIRVVIDSILKQIEQWGFKFEMAFEMDLVWQEILTNAVYHSHGYGRHKKDRVPIQLPDPYKVVVRYARNQNQFGISIRDFRGTLTPKIMLENLKAAIDQQRMLERSLETGEDITDLISDRGRGLDLIRRMTGEYYFIIDPGRSTEIVIIYDGYFEKDDSYSSLKIFELPVSARNK